MFLLQHKQLPICPETERNGKKREIEMHIYLIPVNLLFQTITEKKNHFNATSQSYFNPLLCQAIFSCNILFSPSLPKPILSDIKK